MKINVCPKGGCVYVCIPGRIVVRLAPLTKWPPFSAAVTGLSAMSKKPWVLPTVS